MEYGLVKKVRVKILLFMDEMGSSVSYLSIQLQLFDTYLSETEEKANTSSHAK